MSNHATLSYSGRKPIDTNDDGTVTQNARDDLHTLLNAAIDAYEGDTVRLETAVVHFERGGDTTPDMPRAHVEIAADGPLSELSTIEETIAQQAVTIGLEDDTATAKENITTQ